jgi:UDP-glucuronate 4-epimerase
MKSALITGGAGFIGSNLSERLLSQGWHVSCLDNFDPYYAPETKRRNIQSLLAHPNYRLVEGDIRHKEDVRKAVEGCETAVHLAARAGVRMSLLEPEVYTDVNLNGTVCVLEACRKAGIKRFVFGSSSSVYGNNQKVPFAESDPVDCPISPYAATKRAGELICHSYYHLYRMEMNCHRFFTVYGPRQRPDLAIYSFTKLMEADKPIPVFGDGTSRRDYTFIDDILDGVVKSLENWDGFQIYNLGESQTVELNYLIRLLEQNLGRRARIERRPMQPGDVPQTYADISKARAKLGYSPQVPIEEGIRRFVQWYRKEGKDR